MKNPGTKKRTKMDIFTMRDICRANFNPYLRKVFSKIPSIESGHMLDIGCGTGVSSCEIARTTGFGITAMDIDEASLSVFRQKVSDRKLEQRIKVEFGTFETAIERRLKFDIVLAEGLFNIIGFETGLKQTSTVLKKEGYLVLHDGMTEISSKGKLLISYGFDVGYTLKLDEKVWGKAYCGCLEAKLKAIRNTAELSEDEKKHLKQIKSDIRLYHDSPESFRSIYYVLQKNT